MILSVYKKNKIVTEKIEIYAHKSIKIYLKSIFFKTYSWLSLL